MKDYTHICQISAYTMDLENIFDSHNNKEIFRYRVKFNKELGFNYKAALIKFVRRVQYAGYGIKGYPYIDIELSKYFNNRNKDFMYSDSFCIFRGLEERLYFNDVLFAVRCEKIRKENE